MEANLPPYYTHGSVSTHANQLETPVRLDVGVHHDHTINAWFASFLHLARVSNFLFFIHGLGFIWQVYLVGVVELQETFNG